jgi:hypothetical protein
MSPTSPSPESVDSLAFGKGNESFGRLVNMSTIVRKRSEVSIADGVYRAIVADIEPNVPSRFSSREDLVRIGLDLAQAVESQKPRLWLVSTPLLQDRLQALVEAALRRPITDDEAEGFDLEELLGKAVNIVVASVRSRAGVTYSRIITFLPTEDDDASK